MARDITTDLRTATESKVVYPIALLALEFPSATVRVWTGIGPLSWGGHTWTGAGDMGELSQIEETTEIAAKGLSVKLPGLPSDIAAASLTENYQGRAAKLYLGALNPDGTLVADPYLMLAGHMDQIEKEDSGVTSTLTITIENRLIDLNRNRERRLTDEDQKRDFPSDPSFEFVNALQNRTLLWGNASATGAGTATPPGDGGDGEGS